MLLVDAAWRAFCLTAVDSAVVEEDGLATDAHVPEF